MDKKMAKISFFLGKEGQDFKSIVKEKKIPGETELFKIRDIEVDGISVRFFCGNMKKYDSKNPIWLDFINEKIEDDSDKINFATSVLRPSGLLLISINERVLAACFGVHGASWLEKLNCEPDFGIITAMNMCGNKEIRQTRSSHRTVDTKNISRSLSKPAESSTIGMEESEYLEFMSAHLKDNNRVTLQGKDSLTVKVVGDEKIDWGTMVAYARNFLDNYHSDEYKELFPNYPNFQDVQEEMIRRLDDLLIEKIKNRDVDRMHLAIPEFIPEDEYSFSYSANSKRKNRIHSYIEVSHLWNEKAVDVDQLSADSLKRKKIYAYSHDEDAILAYKFWFLYSCIVVDMEVDGDCYFLFDGKWRKIDPGFYQSIEDFIEIELQEVEVDDEYKEIDIFDKNKKQNREEIFNREYCKQNIFAVKFDQAKLKIGGSKKDKEFCDILEVDDDVIYITHVKRYGGSSSLNYLFSQARFYCQFFLSDQVFLDEIRGYIGESSYGYKDEILDRISGNIKDVNGKDYGVRLWVLYDQTGSKPSKNDLPLMAKYEIKLTCERLINLNKYQFVNMSMIPVHVTKRVEERQGK